MPPAAKRKVSVTLDADLVAEVEAAGEALSARVNAALRADVAQWRRQRALGLLLEQLDVERGSIDTPEDEAEIRRIMGLLGGLVDEQVEETSGGQVAS